MFTPFRKPFLYALTVAAVSLSVSAFAASNARAMRAALVIDYPLTQVG